MQEKHADSHPPEARGNLFITPHAHTSAPPAPAPHPPTPGSNLHPRGCSSALLPMSHNGISPIQVFMFLFFFFFSPCFLRVALTAHGGSQARESELEPLAYTTDTATPSPICVCNLHHSSGQCQIFHPLSEARDQTSTLMDATQIPTC